MQVKISARRESVSISLKHTHEIMEAIKGRNVDKAIVYLEKVLKKEDFIPFRKYPSKGHKHGVPAGFPQKATKEVIELLNELKANAKNSGANADTIVISGYDLGKGAFPRYRGGGIVHKGKRVNLNIFSFAEKVNEIKAPKPENATPSNSADKITTANEEKDVKTGQKEQPKDENKHEEEKKDVTKENT
ncbi:MAG: hypothetical protein M1433_00400 [Candidatus Parvarchaeota archaeon]|nr:hypothetical protein [Candidatus Parvarchaeota archaeon]